MTTKITHEQEGSIESKLDDGNFGWVWMEISGAICSVCRQMQPQSKRDCIEGHQPASTRPGVPIPWMAK